MNPFILDALLFLLGLICIGIAYDRYNTTIQLFGIGVVVISVLWYFSLMFT